MDVFDRASEMETRFREQALAAQAARMPSGPSATHCREPDCGEEIPEARRRALPGVGLCVDCAERKERQRR